MFRLGLLATLFAVVGLAAHAGESSIVVVNGHSMVALRTFGQRFGAAIDYDNGRQAISVAMGGRAVDLVPYRRTAWIGDRVYTLEQPVVIIDDVTYVPLSFMCSAFDLRCDWDNANRQVIIIGLSAERMVFVRDDGWGRRAHVWRRDYDIHDYQRYRSDHQYVPHQQYGGYHQSPQQSWNHGQSPTQNWNHGQPSQWNGGGHSAHGYGNGGHPQFFGQSAPSHSWSGSHGQPQRWGTTQRSGTRQGQFYHQQGSANHGSESMRARTQSVRDATNHEGHGGR